MVIKGYKVKFCTIAKIAYIVFLALTIVYVKSVLKEDSFKVVEKEPKKLAVKIKEAQVKLVVQSKESQKEYTAKLTNGDSVRDFLSQLRKTTDFYYEVDMYTYGTELVSLYGKEADPGNRWAVFFNDEDVTKDISKIKLENKASYIIKQVSI